MTRSVPHARDVAGPEKNRLTKHPDLLSRRLLPLLLLLLLIMECVRSCRSTCCHTDESPSFLALLQTAHVTPRPFPATAVFSSSRTNVAIMPRDFALPNNPPGRIQTAGGRAAYREMCRKFCPRFRLLPHLVSPRLAAAAAVPAAAAAAECARPGRATSNPPSATHSEGTHDYTPIAGLQLVLYFPSSAGIPPSLRAGTPSPSERSDDGGIAVQRAAPSVGGD